MASAACGQPKRFRKASNRFTSPGSLRIFSNGRRHGADGAHDVAREVSFHRMSVSALLVAALLGYALLFVG